MMMIILCFMRLLSGIIAPRCAEMTCDVAITWINVCVVCIIFYSSSHVHAMYRLALKTVSVLVKFQARPGKHARF